VFTVRAPVDSAPAFVATSIPPLATTPPVNVLLLLSVRVPASVLVSDPAPEITPDIVTVNLFGGVRRTAAVTANVVFHRDVEDTAAVLLQFENGPCATVTVTHAAADREDTLDVFGTRGSIRCDNLNAGGLRIVTADGERVEWHAPAANVHLPLIEDFVEAVAANRAPAVDGAIGREIAAIEDQIYGITAGVR